MYFTMKNFKLLFIAALGLTIMLSSCEKEDFGTIEVTSEKLIFDIDSIPVAGPYQKTSVGKWDVDEWATQNKIDLKKGFKEFKYESIKLVITEGDLRLDDFKYIKMTAKAGSLSEKDVVSSYTVPPGTDKELVITTIPDFNFIEYAQAGDVTMNFYTETSKNHVKAGKIRCYPKVTVLDTKRWLKL